jgi:hypothetical protein
MVWDLVIHQHLSALAYLVFSFLENWASRLKRLGLVHYNDTKLSLNIVNPRTQSGLHWKSGDRALEHHHW